MCTFEKFPANSYGEGAGFGFHSKDSCMKLPLRTIQIVLQVPPSTPPLGDCWKYQNLGPTAVLTKKTLCTLTSCSYSQV